MPGWVFDDPWGGYLPCVGGRNGIIWGSWWLVGLGSGDCRASTVASSSPDTPTSLIRSLSSLSSRDVQNL